MKKSFHILIALCIGLMVGLGSNAFAAIGDIVEAQFSSFTFMVDGEVKELEADPLVYNSTTYLPVRVVANLLGKDVVYKADSRTIELNTPTVTEEVYSNMIDLSDYSPELISQQIIAIDATIEQTQKKLVKYQNDLSGMVDDSQRTIILSAIDKLTQDIVKLEAKKLEREEYLSSIKQEYEEKKRNEEIARQLVDIENNIKTVKEFLEKNPDDELYKKALTNLEAQKAALEAGQ